jgi:hypothetical protein
VEPRVLRALQLDAGDADEEVTQAVAGEIAGGGDRGAPSK